MSTHLYAYRCKAEDLWRIHETVREWALKHSPGAQEMIRALACDYLDREKDPDKDVFESRSMQLYERWDKADTSHRDNEDVRIQVFHEPSGTLLLRFFCNIHPTRIVEDIRQQMKKPMPVRAIFVQSSTDMSASDKRNMKVADWVDEQISAKRFSMICALDSLDAWMMLFDHRDPEESQWLAAEIERIRMKRANPEPENPEALRMLAGMLLTGVRRDKQTLEHWQGTYPDEQIQELASSSQQLCGTAAETLAQIYPATSKQQPVTHEQIMHIARLSTRLGNINKIYGALDQLASTVKTAEKHIAGPESPTAD